MCREAIANKMAFEQRTERNEWISLIGVEGVGTYW